MTNQRNPITGKYTIFVTDEIRQATWQYFVDEGVDMDRWGDELTLWMDRMQPIPVASSDPELTPEFMARMIRGLFPPDNRP